MSAQRPLPAAEAIPESAANKLFDLRLLIGGLFILYGLILIAAGITASGAALHKAAGININLWLGAGMLVLGILFLLWRQAQPLRVAAAPRRGPGEASVQPDPRTALPGSPAPRVGRGSQGRTGKRRRRR